MGILIAIPVHNELRYVNRVLDRVRSYHEHILCIDDGSTDGTTELLRQRSDIHLLRHPRNLGYGQSLIDAFSFAEQHGYEWVITMDCDEQHDPAMLPHFVRHILLDRWDVISGSRYLKVLKGDDQPPPDRRNINATLTQLINALFGWSLTDSFCGYKAQRVSSMLSLRLDEPGYAFPMQLWPRAARQELRVKEIPVRLIYNDPSRHFGGNLDNPQSRLRHYLSVLHRELQWNPPAPALPDEEEAPGVHSNGQARPKQCCGCGCD